MTKLFSLLPFRQHCFFQFMGKKALKPSVNTKQRSCWLIGHFSKKGIKEKKAKEMLAHYAKITDEKLKSLTKKHFKKTINKTEDLPAQTFFFSQR